MSRLSASQRVSKNLGVLFLGTTGRMAISFGFVIIVARYLGVGGFGKYSVALRYYDLFLGLSATGLSILITREVARQRERTNAYLSAAVVTVMSLALLAALVMGVMTLLIGYPADTRTAILVVSLTLFPSGIAQMLEAIFLAYETAEVVTVATMIDSVLSAGLGLLFLWQGFGLISLFVALFVARTAVLLYYLLLLRRRQPLKWEFEWSFLRDLLREWRVFAVENWLSTIYGNLGVILVSFFHSEVVVGLYAAAGKLLKLGTVIARSFTTAIYPYLARLFVDSEESFRRISLGSLRYMVVTVLPVVLTIYVMAEPLIRLAYGESYVDAVPMLRVLVWVLMISFFNPYLSLVLFAQEQQRASMRVAAIKLAIYLLGAALLIPPGGGEGAALAKLLSEIVAFGAYLWAVVDGENPLPTLLRMVRAAPPALVLWLFFLITQPAVHPVVAVAGGAIVYVASLFLLRVISWREVTVLLRPK